MRKKFKESINLLLFIMLTMSCFMTILSYYLIENAVYYNDEPNVFPSHCNTVFPHDRYSDRKFIGALDLRISKIVSNSKHAQLFGKVTFYADWRYKKSFLNTESKLTLVLEDAYAQNIFIPIAQSIDLIIVDKKHLRWESDETEIYYAYGDNFNFPFGEQFLAVNLKLMYWDGENREYKEVANIIQAVNLVLPKKYETFSAGGKEKFKEYLDKRDSSEQYLKDKAHICVIKLASWLKWLVMFLMVFFVSSVLLITDKDSEFSSVGFITLLLSVFAIRSILLGDIYDALVYAIDGIFLICMYYVVAVALWPGFCDLLKNIKFSKIYEKLKRPF